MIPFTIEEIGTDHLESLVSLVVKLWPDGDPDLEMENYRQILINPAQTCFLAKHESNYIGFIHLSLRRDHVEGTSTSPVGYIEGIYVEESFRKQSVGKQLVIAGEKWCRSMNCIEIASDTEITNVESIAFHCQLGYSITNRIVCFAKQIESPQ